MKVYLIIFPSRKLIGNLIRETRFRQPEFTDPKDMEESKQMVVYERRKKRLVKFEDLPEEIIWNILTWVPAVSLAKYARYVCGSWYKIVRNPSFIKTQFDHTKLAGFLVQKRRDAKCRRMQFLYMKDGRLRIKEIEDMFPSKLILTCSSGGVVLALQGLSEWWVANPITNQSLKLTPPPNSNPDAVYRMARIPRTGEFKVVSYSSEERTRNYCLHVMTLSGDLISWRRIDGSILNDDLFRGRPATSICAGTVVYWVNESWRHRGRYIGYTDLNHETTGIIHVPVEPCGKACFLKGMGDKLCSILLERKTFTREITTCILKDLHDSEWIRISRINLDGWLYPLFGWFDIDCRRFLWARAKAGSKDSKGLWAFEEKTGKSTEILDNIDDLLSCRFLPHASSLLTW